MIELLTSGVGALALVAVTLIVLCGRSSRGLERLLRLIEAWRRR